MQQNNSRRKRRRRPTFSARFGPSSLALEIGVIRVVLTSGDKSEVENDIAQIIAGNKNNRE